MNQLKKLDASTELSELSARMNRLFNNFIDIQRPIDLLDNLDWRPSLDISETDSNYLVKGELPGMKKQDIHVSLDDGMLTIQGERKEEKLTENETTHIQERSYGKFMRSVRVPTNVEPSKIKAEYENGVLQVTLPKTDKAESKANQIPIN